MSRVYTKPALLFPVTGTKVDDWLLKTPAGDLNICIRGVYEKNLVRMYNLMLSPFPVAPVLSKSE